MSGKKYYLLDFSGVTDRASFHDYVASTLCFPAYYGRNLDALYDCLSETSGCLILRHTAKLTAIGDYGVRALKVFEAAAAEFSSRLTVEKDEDGEKLGKEILALLEKDAKLTPSEIASMLGADEATVAGQIVSFEKEGVILGYNALVDWDRTDREYVSAVIELKVTPSRDCGFDKIASRIYGYPEIRSLQLMSSSGYDLMLTIEGRTMKDVAAFVASKLATIDGVISTATHFVLKKYKDKGVVYGEKKKDERDQMYDGLQ